MTWQHVCPGSIPWSEVLPGVLQQNLASLPFPVTATRLTPGTAAAFNGMALVQTGSATLADGTALARGDLFWCRSPIGIKADSTGCTWFNLVLPPALHPDVERLRVRASDRPWEDFKDPAGRPTQPVQVLLEGRLSALRTRFVPGYVASGHWHDFDTLYFITAGDMRFGFEGQYYTGDIRQVQGGFSYGPEKPGPEGVEFVLFSCGGPVNLHWSDLEPAPQGALQPVVRPDAGDAAR